ncbi:MAG: porin family protein [Bacteroidota bacterium]|nr:porin family protein [Bacteroidota bacterium]MDP4206837.1 porin family protein [Bacteroidota bacterium]
MKKSLIVLWLCLSIISVSNAQRIGIKGGLNFSHCDVKADGITVSPSTLTGFQIGLTSDFGLGESFYLSPELLYSSKGYKIEDLKHLIDYIEIPINLTYRYPIEKISLFVQTGPYLGVGVSSKIKGGGDTETIHFGSGEDQIKRMDFGWNFGGGIEYDKFQLGLRYELGLSNIDNISGASTKNRTFSVTLAYFF